MEVEDIILYIVTVLVPALIGWNLKIQNQVSDLKTEVAVNTSKDDDMWNHVQKMEGKLDRLIESVSEIKQSIARMES